MDSTVKTIVHDLRIREKDVGSYLRVDEKYNATWTKGPYSNAGECWNFDLVEDDCYIILPDSKLHIGDVIAIQRGKTDATRDSSETSNMSNLTNAKIVILPSDRNMGTDDTPDYDWIQGGANCYTSTGLEWDENDTQFVKTDLEYDEFSNIILKAVYFGDVTGWAIISGVGKWDATRLDSEGVMYEAARAVGLHYTVTTQTAGINSLSTGINIYDLQYIPVISATDTGLVVQTSENASESESDVLVPLNAEQTDDSYTYGNAFILGKFQGSLPEQISTRNDLFDEFSYAGINTIGATSGWNTSSTSLNINSINNACNFLGYIYNDSTSDWWAGLDVKSFTKKLGLRPKGQASYQKNVGCIQAVITVDLEKFSLNSSYNLTEPRAVNAVIQSIFDIQDTNTYPYTTVFKVPADCYDAESTDLEDIVLLSSANTGLNTISIGNGYNIKIPLTDYDIANNAFNLIVEFLYRPNTTTTAIQNTLSKFINEENGINQYVYINFTGIEQLRTANISPDVEFQNLGIQNPQERGQFDETGDYISLYDAYLDNTCKSSSAAETGTVYVGELSSFDQFDSISYSSTGTSFFNANGRYRPAKDITKTQIEYDSGLDFCGCTSSSALYKNISTMKYTLDIDWVNQAWYFNGTIYYKDTNHYYTACSSGDFDSYTSDGFYSEEAWSIAFQNGNTSASGPETLSSVKLLLKEALSVNKLGLERIPYLVDYNNTDSVNAVRPPATYRFTHYKTVVNNKDNVETLMDYKCGWKRAESLWTETAYLDGTEKDGLIADYSLLSETESTTSPSKACICPVHIAEYGDDESTALLPYSYSTSSSNRFFSVEGSSTPGFTSSSEIKANPFCVFKFTPSNDGTLYFNAQMPVDSSSGAFGYIIVKETKKRSASTYGDMEFVKDSGTCASAYNNKTNTIKIDFQDKVLALEDLKYSLIFYSLPYLNKESGTGFSSSDINNCNNPLIGRLREYDNTPTLGCMDLFSVYSSDKPAPITVSSDISTIFPDETLNNFDISKFITLMEEAQDSYLFSFNAYVLKEDII